MHFADYKTIISPKNVMNIYRGCTHGCIYCDARSLCYQIKHNFEDIEVKRNADLILEKQLLKKRDFCMIQSGSMCDPYIPLEEELMLTRKCLEIISKHGFGVNILTKSDRILFDINLIQKINNNTKAIVSFTMTTADDELCKIIEPNVCVTSKRYEALKILRDKEIPTVVWITPILPFINDTEENLNKLLDMCIDAKVKGIVFFGASLTLREGNREYFYENLDRFFPGLKEKYIYTFGNKYICESKNNNKLKNIFYKRCKNADIICSPNEVFKFTYEFPKKRQPTLEEFL